MQPGPKSLAALVEQLERLPGIGPRSATRLAHHLVRVPEADALLLADAIRAVRDRIRPCSSCRAPSESDPCPTCSDEGRDRSLLLIVETPRDMYAVEATGAYAGLYFVLGARLSPLEGIDASALDLAALEDRAARSEVVEVCIGTNPDLEGDGTALTLMEALRRVDATREAAGVAALTVTRLARGLPTGGQIEYQSASAIADAFEERRRANAKS